VCVPYAPVVSGFAARAVRCRYAARGAAPVFGAGGRQRVAVKKCAVMQRLSWSSLLIYQSSARVCARRTARRRTRMPAESLQRALVLSAPQPPHGAWEEVVGAGVDMLCCHRPNPPCCFRVEVKGVRGEVYGGDKRQAEVSQHEGASNGAACFARDVHAMRFTSKPCGQRAVFSNAAYRR